MLKSIFFILSVCIISFSSNSGLEALVKPIFSNGPNGSKAHIKDRHWHNTKAAKTSFFKQSIEMPNLSKITSVAINNGKHKKQNNGNVSHEYTFKTPIGKSQGGIPRKTLRVITDPKRSNGNNAFVVTAFPVK